VGTRLSEEYEVGGVLGEGAHAVVYVARRRTDGQTVAVKMVDKARTPIAQVEKEAERLRAVQHHECIVKFHGVFFEQGFACIVMDEYAGGALIDGLHRHLKRIGKVECSSVAHISFQMAKALCHIHGRNIVHRDVKGDNFLMDRKNMIDPECRIALTDFGSSTSVSHGKRLSKEVGTRKFWAPEIFRGDYGPKVDIWAMGVTMYVLLKGSFPFKSDEDICQKNWELNFPSLDSACRDYLRAMLTRDEKARASSEDVMVCRWVDWGRGAAARPIPLASSLPPSSGSGPRSAADSAVTTARVSHAAAVQEAKGEGVGGERENAGNVHGLDACVAAAEKEPQPSWEKWSKIAARSRWVGETLKCE